MRCFLTLVTLMGWTMAARADTFVYVSMAPEQKIQVYRLDPKDGKLTPVEASPVEGAPGALAVDPQKKFLFASLRTNSTLAQLSHRPGHRQAEAAQHRRRCRKGENAAFVGTDRTGRWLLSASYAAGKVVVHRLTRTARSRRRPCRRWRRPRRPTASPSTATTAGCSCRTSRRTRSSSSGSTRRPAS